MVQPLMHTFLLKFWNAKVDNISFVIVPYTNFNTPDIKH